MSTLCRYVGVISPDMTISNQRLRWAVNGMRFTARPRLMTIPVRKKLCICSDVSHTHTHIHYVTFSFHSTFITCYNDMKFVLHYIHPTSIMYSSHPSGTFSCHGQDRVEGEGLILCGHSLGGAVAARAAQEALKMKPPLPVPLGQKLA